MRNFFYPIRSKTPPELKITIKSIVHDLEKKGYAVCNSASASRYFSHRIMPLRHKDIIQKFSRHGETAYIMKPGHKLKIANTKKFQFKIL